MTSALSQSPSVELELTNLATELVEIFSGLDPNSDQELDTQQLLRSYIRHVIRCGLAAGRTGAVLLHDHCVKFQTILKSLLEQPSTVVADYYQVLEQWPILLMSHIQSGSDTGFAQELDDLIHNTAWPVGQDQGLQAPAASPESPAAVTVDAAGSSLTQDELLDELPDDLAALVEELDEAISPLTDSIRSGTMQDGVQTGNVMLGCANRMELFAISAASAGLYGLMDVAQLFQTALRHYSSQIHENDTPWQAFLDLHSAMKDYLTSQSTYDLVPLLTDAIRQIVDRMEFDDNELSALTELLSEPMPAGDETDNAPVAEAYHAGPADTSPVEELAYGESVDEAAAADNGPAAEAYYAGPVDTSPVEELAYGEGDDEAAAADNGPAAEVYHAGPADTSPAEELASGEGDNEAAATDNGPAAEAYHAGPADTSPAEELASGESDKANTMGSVSLSPKSRELLQLIATELDQVSADLASRLQLFSDEAATSDKRTEALAYYCASIGRFIDVFDSIGLDGLSRLFTALSTTLQSADLVLPLDIDQQFWLAEWPGHVVNYLTDPPGYTNTLISHCTSQNTLIKLEALDVHSLTDILCNPQIDAGDEDSVPRQTVASLDDISLQLPDDVNPQLLESLLQELPIQTAEFSRVITNIAQGHGHLQDLETAQRVAHTLKGAANTVGVAGIANLTHHIEDILLAFTHQRVIPVPPLSTTLQDAADVLEMMSEHLLGIGHAPQQQALAVLQQILDWANQIDLNGLPETSQVITSEPQSTEPDPSVPAGASADTSLRISLQSVDETLRLIGETTIVHAQLEEVLRRSLQHNRSVHAQSTLFQQLAFELEQLIEVRGMNSLLTGVTDSAFDALEMDQYNELHTLTRRMVEAATDARALTQYTEDELRNLEGLIHQQKRHTKDTQDVVMKTRMLPVQHIIPRLQRSARQACRLTGKEAELVIKGAQTLIDNDILTSLADPLMHILRNAIDHGIETPEHREKIGKLRTGRIALDFSREGENILIRCQDDGAGLDFQAIKRVAREKGILKEDEILSNDALTRLIFVAGLSTREETTQISGRGIGMDVVFSQVNKMKGIIRVASEPQSGLQIEIQLPATLVTLHGILVRVHNHVVAISSRGVEQILYAEDGVISYDDTTLEYHYLDERYNAYFLEDLLGQSRPAQTTGEINRPAMLLNSGDGKKVAILIDKILNTQDVVIKKLGPYIPILPGVEGVTILGDGSVSPVVDLAVLVSGFEGSDYVPQQDLIDPAATNSSAPKVLVVDDSLSARKSLAEFMHDSGYRVATARDGIEAIAQMDAQTPDILLVDMEMPRMNGLELASYVRANKATQNLPIIMITSRATDKHREEAKKAGVNAYLIKPYTESQVLDQITAQLANTNTKSNTK